MGNLHSLVILLCFVPSLSSLYLDQIVPRVYYPNVVRSAIPKAVSRSEITDPQLAQLLMARKQAIKITKDIDSEIKTRLQDKIYRRTFYGAQDTDPNGFPFFNVKPMNSLSAVIGVQGGAWFPGPSGVGMTGSHMLEGQANHENQFNHFGFRRTQDAQLPLQRGHGPAPGLVQTALAMRNKNAQMARQRLAPLGQTNLDQTPVSHTYMEPAPLSQPTSLDQTTVSRTALEQAPLSQTPFDQTSVSQAALEQVPLSQTPLGEDNQISTRTFTPTTAQSTPDPSDEIEHLGNPEEFDEKCEVLKLTFEKSDGDLVFDDSPQRNDGQLKGEARVLKDETDLGRSVVFGNNGKIVLQDGFKGKPKKSVAISMWVRLNYVKGIVPLITVTDKNNFVRYDLLLRNGKGEWVHRGDSGRELFRVQSSSSDITAGEWHNIVGSYDSMSRTASLWVDGKEVSKQDDVSGVLSQKWNKLTIFGGKSRGDMDNIFMFRCPLDKTKIVALYVSDATHKDVKKD